MSLPYHSIGPMPRSLKSIACAEDGLISECSGTDSVATLIFVDIDGVLNVGIHDPGSRMLAFSDENIKKAFDILKNGDKNQQAIELAERIMSVYERKLPHEGRATYKKYASSTKTNLSDLLIRRLAAIIRAAAKNTLVVLSSQWRLSEARYKPVEQALSKHLNRTFAFDAKTALVKEVEAAERLQNIGSFIESFCDQRGDELSNLRVLVLDDMPLGGECSDGKPLQATKIAEEHLRKRAPAPLDMRVKFVHTYEEWKTHHGSTMQVGTGITTEHFRDAMDFLMPAKGFKRNSKIESQPEIRDMDERLIFDVQDCEKLSTHTCQPESLAARAADKEKPCVASCQ